MERDNEDIIGEEHSNLVPAKFFCIDLLVRIVTRVVTVTV